MTNMPRYKIYYKRYDTLGTYIIDCETIDDIVKHSEKLALNTANTISQGIYHEINIKQAHKSESAVSITAAQNLTQGTYHIVDRKKW